MKDNEYTRNDLQADLDIIGYCFADMIRSRMERHAPSDVLQKRMEKTLMRVREIMDEDEEIVFDAKISMRAADGSVPPIGDVSARIEKKDET